MTVQELIDFYLSIRRPGGLLGFDSVFEEELEALKAANDALLSSWAAETERRQEQRAEQAPAQSAALEGPAQSVALEGPEEEVPVTPSPDRSESDF